MNSGVIVSNVFDFEIREQKKVSIPLLATAFLFLFLALGLRIWIHAQCMHYGYKMADSMQAEVEYDMSRRELELQKSVLLRPDYLEKKANALGLERLNPSQARKINF